MSSLRFAVCGAAPATRELLAAAEEFFDVPILEGYGLTEATCASAVNPIDGPRKPGTVGPALPGQRIRIVDDELRDVPTGQTGEVLITGAVVMAGYLNMPEATAQTIVDGWVRTGDVGRLYEDGYLSIVDRVKDLIIRGGYNVYPREVEEVLWEHPDIVEVAVVGVPDEHYGEEIAAVTVLAPGSEATPESIRAWAKERLSAYKVPHLFAFVDALPKGATGKILKRAIDRDELRELASKAVRA